MPYIWHAFWLPAAVTSVIVGLLWAVVFYANRVLGWGLFIGVPGMIGVLVGYRVRGSMKIGYVLLLLILGCVIIGLGLGGYAGVFCMLMLVGVFGGISLLGLFSGVLLGRGLAAALKRSNFAQRSHLPVLVLVLLGPSGLHLTERAVDFASGGPAVIETVKTTLVVTATPDQAYDAWLFYEDVTHRPPWLLRLGLPTPRRTLGRIRVPGDVQICVYSRGRLVKRATRVVPGRELAFEVIAQEHVEDRSIRLIDGGFTFESLGSGGSGGSGATAQTRVTLTTRYEPLLTPRWMWRSIEHATAGAMHRHVLEGMAVRLLVEPTVVVSKPGLTEPTP